VDPEDAGVEETRSLIARLNGTMRGPMSCKGIQKAPETPVSGVFTLCEFPTLFLSIMMESRFP
jgi:hypothetical protein